MRKFIRRKSVCLAGTLVGAVVLINPPGAHAQAVQAQDGATRGADASNTIKDDPISWDSLTLEIALARKTLADERFLANDQVAAKRGYCTAKTEVVGGLQLSTAKANARELLKADIDYRLLLLDRGIDYWGAIQTLTPDLPKPRLETLEGLLLDFEKISAEITVATRQIGAGDVEAGKLEAISREIDGRVQAETVNQQRIAIERTFQEDRQDSLDERVVELKRNRQRLENQLAAAVAQARAASSQLNRALVNAAASSLGVPPDVVQSVKDGKLDRAVLSAVTNSDLLQSAEFTSALAQVSSSNEVIAGYVKQGQELVRQGQQAKRQLEGYKADIELAARTYRNPSIEGLAKVGEQIYVRLDDKTKREWGEKIRAAKPVMGAIELARTLDDTNLVGHLREGAERYLAGNANFAREYIRSEIDRYVKSAATEAQSRIGPEYAKLLGEIAKLKLDDKAVEHLLDQILRSWPKAVLNELPAALVEDMLGIAAVPNRDALEKKLREQGLRLVKERIIVRRDRVEFYDRSTPPRSPVRTIRLPDLGELPSKNEIERYGISAQQAFENELERLRRAEGDLRQLLLKRLPEDALENALRRSLDVTGPTAEAARRASDLKNRAWQSILRSLPSDKDRQQVIEQIASMHVGSVYVAEWESSRQEQAEADLRQYSGTQPQEDAAGGGQGRSAEEAMAEQVAMMALNAVVPGASVAVEVAKSFVAFGEAIDKAKRLSSELQANLSEELQLIEMIKEARLKQVVLGKEREVSEIMKASAKAQYESYRFAVTQVGTNQDKERSYIAIRRKLAFYIAERMREEFDGLDRSLGLWAGRRNSPRGVIAEMVKTDPQNLRLALDSEIHLFDWLNRERESTRTDVDGLMMHWRQLVRLSKDLCQRLGCSTGIGALGQVHQTDALRLTDLVSAEDLRRLRRWKESGSNQPLNLTVFLQPDGRFLPLAVDNVRVVDVRIGTRWPSGRLSALTRVLLSHPGVGYIQSGGTVTREVLLPVQRWGHATPETFDTQELLRSWQGAGRLREFEGYPLYSAWRITLEPVEENLKSEEIWIRFGYRYIDRANIATERQYVDSTEDGPAGLFEPAIVWQNDKPEALVNIDGRPTRVSLPASGQVNLPFDVLSLLNTRPPEKSDAICEDLPGPASLAPAPALVTDLQVVAVCKPDEDMKRMLLAHYTERQRNSSEGSAHLDPEAMAMAEFARLKANECSEPRPISALEVRP